MKDLFDWKRVEQEVQVITPEFQVWKKGKLTTVVVYAKNVPWRIDTLHH